MVADGVDVDGELRERLAKVVGVIESWAEESEDIWLDTAEAIDLAGRVLDALGLEQVVRRLQDVHDAMDDKGLCPYFRRGEAGQDPHGSCAFGCQTEPSCQTDRWEPWPSEALRGVIADLSGLASPSLTPSPEADVRSEQSEANRTTPKEGT